MTEELIKLFMKNRLVSLSETISDKNDKESIKYIIQHTGIDISIDGIEALSTVDTMESLRELNKEIESMEVAKSLSDLNSESKIVEREAQEENFYIQMGSIGILILIAVTLTLFLYNIK